jgi:uncharacterized repeat protein (TIGR03803 family)
MTRFEVSSLVCVLCAATMTASPAQTFKSLASFRLVADGGYPQYMSLVQGTDGSFYGTAPEGGVEFWGSVFKVASGGALTFLCYFGEDTCYQESHPFSGLIQATDGNFYGTTWQGGVNNTGAVFEMAPEGTVTLLYSFCSQSICRDGGDPFAPLIQAADGNFYGTTFDGGTNGYGTVFTMTAAGTLTTLHSFDYADGAGPVAGLIQAKNGDFYGTTLYGGTAGAGTVFEITSAGKLTLLHSFGSAGDGANPYAALVQAADGNFYGTTHDGGTHGDGVIFRITPGGKVTTLYSFCSQAKCTDGAEPFAGIIQASDGNFYGTTSKGGDSNWGTVLLQEKLYRWSRPCRRAHSGYRREVLRDNGRRRLLRKWHGLQPFGGRGSVRGNSTSFRRGDDVRSPAVERPAVLKRHPFPLAAGCARPICARAWAAKGWPLQLLACPLRAAANSGFRGRRHRDRYPHREQSSESEATAVGQCGWELSPAVRFGFSSFQRWRLRLEAQVHDFDH